MLLFLSTVCMARVDYFVEGPWNQTESRN